MKSERAGSGLAKWGYRDYFLRMVLRRHDPLRIVRLPSQWQRRKAREDGLYPFYLQVLG